MIDYILQGGLLFMLPLIGMSVGVVAIGIERTIRYRRASVGYASFAEAIQGLLDGKGVAAARVFAEETPGPVARVWSEGLRFARMPTAFVRERMGAAALRELERLEKYLPELTIISQAAPLIGILGTVCGLIISFQAMESSLVLGVGLEGGMLTGGIWKALIVTASGLFVALPALLLHHFLTRRVQGFTSDMDRSIEDLIAFLALARLAAPGSTASASHSEARTAASRLPTEAPEIR